MKKNIFYKHKIENLIVIEKIVTIHYFEFTKDYRFEGESHDFWEIVYVDKGEVICSRGEEDIVLKQGGIIFHKPNEFHTIRANGITAPNAFVMTFVCRSEAMSFFNGKQFDLNKKLRQYISWIMEEARQTFDIPLFNPALKKLDILKNPILGGQQMIRTYLEQFLILLMRLESNKSSSHEAFIPKESLPGHIEEMIIEYLMENIDNKITLQDVCKKFSYGKTFLCTQFKKSTGKSIMNYFMDLKIEKAKKLIREKNTTISQISENLGFNNPAHFSNTFRKITGMTPKQYLNSVK
ncbi:MAG TPA: AraC family transcriptional regulator [Clostridia bacterium]